MELRHVGAELASRTGAYAAGVWVPDHDTLVLDLGPAGWWCYARSPIGRFHPTRRRPKNPKVPFSFQSLLRARMSGALLGVSVEEDDAVIVLRFAAGALHLWPWRGGGAWWVEDGSRVGGLDGPCDPAFPPRPPPLPVRPARFALGDGGQAATQWFEAAVDRWREAELRDSVRRGLRQEIARLDRLVVNLTEDLDRAGRSDELRRQADALAAVLHRVPRGADTMPAPDLEDPERVHNVRLDPTKAPSITLAKLYDKASRLDRAVDHIFERLTGAEDRRRDANAALVGVDAAERAALDALARRWRIVQAAPRRNAATATDPWWTWEGPDGLRVLVGRSDKGNHALTFRQAKGRDGWMHLRERAGAHLVLPNRRPEGPDPRQIAAAAQIARRTARIDPAEVVEVQLARVADVKAIKGGAPGKVIVEHERVLRVEHREEALHGWFHVQPDGVGGKETSSPADRRARALD